MGVYSMHVAAFCAVVASVRGVTVDTQTPTSDSNYMVMQGDIDYKSGTSTDFGPMAGRIQMVRSAIAAQTEFSFSLHFGITANAPSQGTQIEAKLGRHICAIPDFVAFQDPYACPGYSPDTNTNTCPSSSDVEVDILCTVDQNGACVGSFTWNIYLHDETFESGDTFQSLESLSFTFFESGSAFACANFDQNRRLEASDSFLRYGEVEKDELGYTHVSLLLEGLDPSTSNFHVHVRDAPCSSSEASFSPSSSINGLTQSFNSDASGDAEVNFHTSSIVDASTMSIVILQSGVAFGCFDLEIAGAFGFSRQGDEDTSTESPAVGSGCDVWATLYEEDFNQGPIGKGGSSASSGSPAKSKPKNSKKRGKHGLDMEDFSDTLIGGVSRCCFTDQALADFASFGKGGKGKKGKSRYAASVTARFSQNSHQVQAGLGVGLAGLVILAVAVALNVRRRYQAPTSLMDIAPIVEESATEKTALLDAPSPARE